MTQQLRAESLAKGDEAMVKICDSALEGHYSHRVEVAAALTAARCKRAEDSAIRQLRAESLAKGDEATVTICDSAIEGHQSHRVAALRAAGDHSAITVVAT